MANRNVFPSGWLILASVMSMASFSGCSSESETTAVTVKVFAVHPVTMKKEPVLYGRVILLNIDKDKYFDGELLPNGTVTIKNVPLGKTKVTVRTENPRFLPSDPKILDEQKLKRPSAEVFAKWFPINKVYSTFDETPLEITVERGKPVSLFLKRPYRQAK